MNQLDFIYASGETRRFHTWPVLREQNVAAHSWHVAMIGYTLYGQEEPGITTTFLMALLCHDMAECQTGDMPSPAKRRLDAMLELKNEEVTFRQQWNAMEQEVSAQYGFDWEKFLTEEELRRFKLADNFEGALYCVTERSMGNRLIKPCYDNYIKYLGELMFPDVYAEDSAYAREWSLFTYIKAMWEIAHAS